MLRSLDGVWGVVGTTGTNGNLYRIERSLKEPVNFTVTEYQGNEETEVLRELKFGMDEKDQAVKTFAEAIGFVVSG